jgi:hypothetical protein
MRVFGRKDPELPGPSDPFPEHLTAIAAGQDGAISAFVRALLAQDVWEAWRTPPPGFEPGMTGTVQEQTSVAVLGSEMPDGGRALAIFSSEAAVRARAPQAFPVRRTGADVLRPILDGEPGLEGIVFDPAGPVHQLLRAQWIRDVAADRP